MDMGKRQKRSDRRQRYVDLSPTNTLPQGYRLRDTFSLGQSNYKRLIVLNLLGAVLFVALGWVFLSTVLNLRPDMGDAIIGYASQSTLIVILGNLLGMAVMIGLHELTHALFFWWYTRERPVIGLRRFYAYAAAPGWYLPRGHYFVVALAPLVLLTLLGYAALLRVPMIVAMPLLFGITMNAAGSIGDIAVVLWLLRKSKSSLVEDVGDAMHLYLP